MNNLIEDIKLSLSILKVESNLSSIEIEFFLKQVKQQVLNITNLKDVPIELETVLLKRTVGSILESFRTNGTLVVNNEKVEDFNLSSITRGDVSMSYKGTSASDKFNELINSYINYGEKEILTYRVIKWI